MLGRELLQVPEQGGEAQPQGTSTGSGLAVHTGFVPAGHLAGLPTPIPGQEGCVAPTEQWHSQTPYDTPTRSQRANSPIPSQKPVATHWDPWCSPDSPVWSTQERAMAGPRSMRVSGFSRATISSSVTLARPLAEKPGPVVPLSVVSNGNKAGAMNPDLMPGAAGESEHHQGLLRATLDPAGVEAGHLTFCKALESGIGALCTPRAFRFPHERVSCTGPGDLAANPGHAAHTLREKWPWQPFPRHGVGVTVNSKSASPIGGLPRAGPACPGLPLSRPGPQTSHTPCSFHLLRAHCIIRSCLLPNP